MKKLLLPVLVSVAVGLHSQQIHRCQTYEHTEFLLQNDTAYRNNLNAINASAALMEQQHPNGYQPRAVVTIPVVFHVVYQNAAQNLSTSRLMEQITTLNEDYRKMNADRFNVPSAWQGIAADCEIQFCLAQRDPSGNWTNGITRTSTTHADFQVMLDDVKSTSTGGQNAWNNSVYLNIWVCDLETGVLGYAQLPGGPAATDGVVLDFAYTGTTGASAPFNKGRTGTHEVGHYFNLLHIWGDDGNSCSGSDAVSDTPNQGNENYGCFTVGQVITDACSASSPGTMWQNYMDYTDDACMYMFTAGQKTRMWNCLNGARLSLQTSLGCVLNNVNELSLGSFLSIYPTPSDGMVTLDFGMASPSGYDINVYNTLGERVKAIRIEMLNERTYQLDLRDQAAGAYFIEVHNGSDKATRRVIIQ